MDPPPTLAPNMMRDMPFVDNMDVDVEDSLAIEHDAPTEKTDQDFFNGEPLLPRFCLASEATLTALSQRATAAFEDDFDDEDLD